MAVNQVSLAGRLTKKPEAQQAGEHKIVRFSLAVNEGYGDKEKTSFLDCEAWDKTAEFMSNYLDKGNRVFVSGRLSQKSWEKDGQKYSKVVVSASQVESLEPRKKIEVQTQVEEVSPADIPF